MIILNEKSKMFGEKLVNLRTHFGVYLNMKLRKHINYLMSMAAVMVLMLTSCLGDNDAEYVVTNYWNAVVTSFSLETNANVAPNLSSYKFTIDNYGLSDERLHAMFPNDGIIFNPDSLPYGTIADSVKVKMSFSQPDSVYFTLYSLDGRLGQWSDFAKDSALYFASYSDCRLRLVSRGGVSKTYHIKINVHHVNGDSIKWNHYTDDVWAGINVTDQRADSIGDRLFWLAEADGRNLVSTALLSENARLWSAAEEVNVEGGELLDLGTLYSWHGQLLAVGQTSQALMASEDGVNWRVANAGYQFENIVGNQLSTQDVYKRWNSDTLSVIVNVEGVTRFAVSANGTDWRLDREIPEGFPVRGFSRPISVAARSSQGNLTSRLYLVGGVDARGNLTGSTWSCDGYSEDLGGRNWAEFQQNEMPAMQGATILDYTLDADKPGSFWILQPGQLSDGTVPVNKLYAKLYTTLYYSEDSGVSWHRLSRYYPRYADNSEIGPVSAHSGMYNLNNYEIYFFGGRREDGSQLTTMWGGQLPKLTFKKVR